MNDTARVRRSKKPVREASIRTRAVWRRFMRGESVAELARRYHCGLPAIENHLRLVTRGEVRE